MDPNPPGQRGWTKLGDKTLKLEQTMAFWTASAVGLVIAYCAPSSLTRCSRKIAPLEAQSGHTHR